MPHTHGITPAHDSAIVWLLLAAALLCAPTARRDSAQSRETTTTTTNCWSISAILRIVSSISERCSKSVTESPGCLACKLRRKAFAYVRAPYGPMVYHLVGATAWWLRARHDRRAASSARPLFTPARGATRPTFCGAFPRRLLASRACDARADSPSKWQSQASPWQPCYGHVTPVAPTDLRGTPCYAMRRPNTLRGIAVTGCHRVTGLFKGLGRVVAGGAGYEWPVKSQGSDVHFKRDVVTAAFGRGVNDD